MTTLNFALTRTLGRELQAGDEIVVTRLDHDGNVSPWLHLARDLDLTVRFADLNDDDATLDMDDLERQLTERTRVVAFPWASNAVGTITDAARIVELAHDGGRARLGGRSPLRAALPDRRARARGRRAPLLAVQVLRPASRPLLRPTRAARALASLQGAPGARRATRRAASRPARSRTRRSRASTRPSRTSSPSAGRASPPTSASSGNAYSQAFRTTLRLHGPPTMDGRVATFAVTVPGTDAGGGRDAPGRARPRRLVGRLLRGRGNAAARASRRRTPARDHPLQHRRGGRPPARRRSHDLV